MYRWRYLDEAGATTGTSEVFDGRAAAEEWLGTAWKELLEASVRRVELIDEASDASIYDMSLDPEDDRAVGERRTDR
jgi:hypothetical protein